MLSEKIIRSENEERKVSNIRYKVISLVVVQL